MRGRTRLWTLLIAGTFMAGYGVLLSEPVFVFASFVFFTWIVANQLAFLFEVKLWQSQIEILRSVQPKIAQTEQPVSVTTEASAQLRANSEAKLITAVPDIFEQVAGKPEIAIGSLNRAATNITVTAPVAGSFTVPKARLAIQDQLGLFSEKFPIGETVSIRIDPPQPRNIHIGMGGERLAAAYGEHEAESGSGGMVPEELRTYVPGDPVKLIDWNATARHNEPYVRAVQAQTDRRTVIIFDRRDSMDLGPPGKRKVDFARQIAAMYVEGARNISDPLGYREIGSAGETTILKPGTAPERYRTIDELIREAEPIAESFEESHSPIGPGTARSKATQLDGGDPFGNRLRQFFESGETYVRHVESDPLFTAIEAVVEKSDGQSLAIILTDDSHKVEVRQAAKLLSASGNQAMIFLQPEAVFAERDLNSLDEAYRSYVNFETYRRKLSRLDSIQAFEVAPEDRIIEILDHARTREQSVDQ